MTVVKMTFRERALIISCIIQALKSGLYTPEERALLEAMRDRLSEGAVADADEEEDMTRKRVDNLGELYTLRDSIAGNVQFKKNELAHLERWLERLDKAIEHLEQIAAEGRKLEEQR